MKPLNMGYFQGRTVNLPEGNGIQWDLREYRMGISWDQWGNKGTMIQPYLLRQCLGYDFKIFVEVKRFEFQNFLRKGVDPQG